MYIENLNSKPIWEFNEDDTIYISQKIKGTGNNHVFHCKFIKLIRNVVYGEVLSIDKGTAWDRIKVGDLIHAEIKKCALYGKGASEGNAHYHWFNPIGYAYKEIGLSETDKELTHPSFGLIRFSRGSHNGSSPLFGSNIQHQHTITLSIKRAEHNRHLNNDWYHGKEELIEVEISGAQFAELITSFNMGEGVPCTIREFNGSSYPDPPYESPVDIFQKEFKAELENLGKKCSSAVEDAFKILKEKPTLNKADREFVLSSFQSLIQEVRSNIPFVSQQFNESMDKTVSQAKAEIETFVTNRMTSLGVEAAKTNPNLFLGTNTPDVKQID